MTIVQRKRKSLLCRAVLSNTLLVAISGGLLAALLIQVEIRALDEQLRLRAGAVAEFLARQGQFGLLIGSREQLEQVATAAMSVEDVLFVEVRDRTGRTVASRVGPAVLQVPELPPEALDADNWSAARTSGIQFVDLLRSVQAPATGGLLEWEGGGSSRQRLGAVRIGFSASRQRKVLIEILSLSLLAAVICLLVIFTAQFVKMRGLLRPLAGLIEVMREVGRGNLARRARVERPDEVGELALAVNQMLDELRSTLVSRDYVNNILQSIDESMIVVGEDGRIRTLNPAALAMLGYSEGELIGQPGAIVAGETTGTSGAHERTYRLRDGSEVPVLFSAARLPGDEAGQEVWLARDISERKRVEQELRLARQTAERASQAKSDLLSRTSHELRTPLNAILGFGQLLEMSELAPEDAESVAQIMKGGRHLLKLVNEVLDIAAVEAGRRPMSIEAVRVRDSVSEAVNLVAPLDSDGGIALEIEDAPELDLYIHADRLRLQQVLLNLLSNAVKYNRPGGSAAVCCSRTAESIRIAVRDTGGGISKEGLERLFVPFERLGAEAREVEGTGLGLVWARSFAEAMGGAMGVSSVLGEGSTFWIDLPACSPPLVEATCEEFWDDLGAEAGTHTLLYVEDNASNRSLMERVMLRRPTWTLVSAKSGVEGLSLAREIAPDLILLDLHLPDIWGDEVLRRMRLDPLVSCPIVMLTADANPSQMERLLAAGADEYLSKPLNVRKFLHFLDETLSKGTERCLGLQHVS